MTQIVENFDFIIPITNGMLARWFKELFDGADDIKPNVKEKDMSVWFKTQEEWKQDMTIWQRYAIYFFRSREIRVQLLEDDYSWTDAVLRFHTMIAKLKELSIENLNRFIEIIGNNPNNCFDRAMFLIDCCEKENS